MPKSIQKIALSQSRPFNCLVLTRGNVRRIKAGVWIEELAEDIARRTLLQSLTVRSVLNDSGVETGMFEIPAGGRRYRPGGNRPTTQEEPDEDEGVKPIPDRLMTELTAYRTLALRDALGQNWDVAFLAALQALCLKLFYRYATDSCVEIEVKSVAFGNQAPGAQRHRHRKSRGRPSPEVVRTTPP
jgi:hypothetical protein